MNQIDKLIARREREDSMNSQQPDKHPTDWIIVVLLVIGLLVGAFWS